MTDIRQINRVLCYIPALCVSFLIVAVLIGTFKFGNLPVYGTDPDPYSLSLDWINGIAVILMMISFFAIPAIALLTWHLVYNKIKFARKDKIALLMLVLSFTIFLCGKYFFSNTFEWVMD